MAEFQQNGLYIFCDIIMLNKNSFLTISILIITLLMQAEAKMFVEAPPDLTAYFQKLYGDQGIPYSIANYGVVPYGKTVSGKLGFPTVLEDCVYQDIDSNQRAPIIMVQRNDCTFTQKSINVQKEGGKLAIIIDNKVQSPGDIVMIDDGHGFQVSIPTILISSEDGKKLVSFASKFEQVVVSVHFESIAKYYADVSLWIDITNHQNMIFVRNFQNYYQAIQKKVKLNLNYPIQLCTFDCNSNYCFTAPSQNQTINYCRYPRFYDWSVDKVGQIIIWEQIRQYYIFNASPKLWFTYLLKFDQICAQVVNYQYCGAKIIKNMNITDRKVLEFLSFRNQLNQQEINLISEWQNSRLKNNILFYPSFIVNGIPYRGNLQPLDVFQLICQSITPFPKECEANDKKGTLNNTTIIILIMIIVVFFIAFLVFCFRRIIRQKMLKNRNKQVDELVNQYITMFEEQKFAKSEAKQVQMQNK